MPAGFQVINNNNSILIDQDYANLALIAKGTETGAGSPYSSGTRTGLPFLSTADTPLIFVQSSSFVKIGAVSYDRFGWWMQGAGSFNWWAYSRPQSAVSHAGLQVFNGAGSLMFDGGFSYLRMVQFINTSGSCTFPDTGGTGNINQYGLAQTSNVAFCLSDPGYYTQLLTGSAVSGGLSYRSPAGHGGRFNGGVFEVAAFQWISSMSLPANVNVNSRACTRPWQAIIMDTTYAN